MMKKQAKKIEAFTKLKLANNREEVLQFLKEGYKYSIKSTFLMLYSFFGQQLYLQLYSLQPQKLVF